MVWCDRDEALVVCKVIRNVNLSSQIFFVLLKKLKGEIPLLQIDFNKSTRYYKWCESDVVIPCTYLPTTWI